jgi:hypothetical protein
MSQSYRRKALRLALATALMTGSAEAAASAQQDTYHAIGQGASSCGTWSAARRNQYAFGYEQWVWGFLSGVGFQGGANGVNPLNGVDADAVWGWIDNYCQGHPLELLASASTPSRS